MSAGHDMSRERSRTAEDACTDAAALEAARWVVRRREHGPAVDAAHRAWLAEHPDHRAAWRQIEATHADLLALPDEVVRAFRRPPSAATPAPVRRRLVAYGPLLAGLCAVLILVAGLKLLLPWSAPAVFEQRFATTRGLVTSVALPDGSVLDLDTATGVQVRFDNAAREVRLDEGQLRLDVQQDAARPLRVIAGDVQVTVTGTRFSVRHTRTGLDAGATRIMVEHGSVLVERTTMPVTAPLRLAAGDTVLIEQGRWPDAIDRLVSADAAWREGRLNFVATPITAALAEFERYGPTGLVVEDADVAALRIDGSFRVQRLADFRRALVEALPLKVVTRGPTQVLVADGARDR